MITIRSMKHISTAKVIRGFRSGGSRQRSRYGEFSRIMAGYAEMFDQEVRRQRLNTQWQTKNPGM